MVNGIAVSLRIVVAGGLIALRYNDAGETLHTEITQVKLSVDE
jgi:hypothetical protein